MIPLAAALAALSQPAPSAEAIRIGRTAWIFSTIDQSEFCPAGNVRLDLRTGRYAVTAGAPRRICNTRNLERPVRTGRLGADRLAAVRAAYRRVVAEGLTNPVCEAGGHPDEIVISNGGTPIMVVASGAWTVIPPDDLTCWSDAANALHALLDDEFGSEGRRQRR